MILLTDTFGVEQIEAACTVSIEKVEIAEVQAALAHGFDVYFEFGELAQDARVLLGLPVPRPVFCQRPRFNGDFTLIVVGFSYVTEMIHEVAFWKVQGAQ